MGTGINRILIYTGCFSSPHVGHFEIFRHAYTQLSGPLNIVAAIVLPRSDMDELKQDDVEILVLVTQEKKEDYGFRIQNFLSGVAF